jgi:hypothetical protein
MRDRICEVADNASTLINQDDRRRIVRVSTQFGLLYSGMDSGRMLIGDGMATNLSEEGVCIYGNRLVKPGMELALFVDLPGTEEPVCLSEGRVLWVAGRQFGVQLHTVKIDAQNQLPCFLRNHQSA